MKTWASIITIPTTAIDYPYFGDLFDTTCSDAQKALRTQAVVDALRKNTLLLDVGLPLKEFDKVLLDNDVYPRLLSNKYRPRVTAIAKEKGEWRRKLLLRALASVAGQPNLI
jgi:hypothetical protein